MSNMNPNTSGITKRWKPGYDARCRLRDELVKIGYDSLCVSSIVDDVLEALMAVVDSSAKSVFVGVGTFAWRPWTARNPRTGDVTSTWHLSFKPCRYRKEKYNGSRR